MPVALKKRQTSTRLAGTAKSMRCMSKRLALIVNGLPIMPPSSVKERSVAPALAKTAGAVARLPGGATMAPGCRGSETRIVNAVVSEVSELQPMPMPNPKPSPTDAA